MRATLSEAKVILYIGPSVCVCGAFSIGSVVLHSFMVWLCSMHLTSNTVGVAMQVVYSRNVLFSQLIFVRETPVTGHEPIASLMQSHSIASRAVGQQFYFKAGVLQCLCDVSQCLVFYIYTSFYESCVYSLLGANNDWCSTYTTLSLQ